jgi:hypothetical protein
MHNHPVILTMSRAESIEPWCLTLSSTSELTGLGSDEYGLKMIFPPGGRGYEADSTSEAHKWPDSWKWVRFNIRYRPAPPKDSSSTSATSEDVTSLLGQTLAEIGNQECACILMATPLNDSEVDSNIIKLSDELVSHRRFDQSIESQRRALMIDAEIAALEGRFSTGPIWKVDILFGAPSESSAREFGALWLSAANLGDASLDFGGSQPAKNPALETDTWISEGVGGCHITTDALRTLVDVFSTELPGLAQRRISTFDVNQPRASKPEYQAGVLLGEIIDSSGNQSGQTNLSLDSLARHTFVCGATGSGKSEAVRTILEGLSTLENPIPWLVIEPAKSEYATMAKRIAKVPMVRIRIGDPNGVAVSINPLEPSPGFPLQTHADLVRGLFLAAFEATEPFPQVVSQALHRLYTDFGWNLATGLNRFEGDSVKYPTLTDLETSALQVVEDVGYGSQVKQDVSGFIKVRLGSLRVGAPGRFLEGGHPLDFSSLLTTNAVLEIEDVASDEEKAFIIGVVLVRLYEHLRQTHAHGNTQLRHITVIEEAHRLLRNRSGESSGSNAVELFASMLAEIRAYGEGIIVAEQIPSKIIPDVVKNSAVKVMLRLPSKDDREFVGATMNLDEEQSRFVVGMSPGYAAVHTDGMDSPLLTRVRLGHDIAEPQLMTQPRTKCSANPGCPVDCFSSPCTTLQMSQATSALGTWVQTWIELVCASAITGCDVVQTAKSLREPFLIQLRSLDPRQRSCLFAQFVHKATMRRRSSLTPTIDTDFFERLVMSILESAVVGIACEVDEASLLGGFFRWIDLECQLGEEDGARSPVDPVVWSARGVPISGITMGQQHRELDRYKRLLNVHKPSLAVFGEEPGFLSIVGESHESISQWASDYLTDVPDALLTWIRESGNEGSNDRN